MTFLTRYLSGVFLFLTAPRWISCFPHPTIITHRSGLIPPLQSQSGKTIRHHFRSSLDAVSKQQTVILDGAELASMEAFSLLAEKSRDDTGTAASTKPSAAAAMAVTTSIQAIKNNQRRRRQGRRQQQPPRVGVMTVVVGTVEEAEIEKIQQRQEENNNNNKQPRRLVQGCRVVGVQMIPTADNTPARKKHEDTVSLGGGIRLYEHSVAIIPDQQQQQQQQQPRGGKGGISDADVISTYAAALVPVHCALPRVEQVGGADDDDVVAQFVSGKVVVLGGGEYACFAAEGLAALGADVSLVTTSNVRLKDKRVNVMGPAVGEFQLGFASVLGQFDSLVDTISDEARIGDTAASTTTAGDGDYDNSDPFSVAMGSGVLTELKRQHKCGRYISTFTAAQKIVRDAGVLFGPKQAEEYQNEIVKFTTNSSPLEQRQVVPPKDFGSSTVQKLLDEGIIFPSSGKDKNKDVFIRGWSLKDFWELASWPRDSSGGANVRFGLPVIDDIEDPFDEVDEEADAERISSGAMGGKTTEGAESKNPYVLEIVGVEGLNQHILSGKRDCVLFLSAPYCRTCRYIRPQFTRMARINTERFDGGVTFAKAETVGKVGKELGRALGVEAVPAFVMFREGRRYGTPLSVTRLPSKRLDLAVEYLTSGMEWDSAAFIEDDAK